MTEIIARIEPDDGAEARILAILEDHAQQAGVAFTLETRAYEARDGESFQGGAVVRYGTAWGLVALFAVVEGARGQGIGRALMQRIEADAIAMNKAGLWLDSFSFQAPGFYARLGFAEFGRIPCYLGTETRHFFFKRFDGR